MNFLVPNIRVAWLPAMLGYSGLGALFAGCYGIVHDQITYSISSEYFTRLKFVQFRYADFGFPPRVLVAEIGFLATWWVGFIAAWFLARVAVGQCERDRAWRLILRGFAIVLGCTFFAGLLGYIAGRIVAVGDLSYWEGFRSLGVVDLPQFVRVAYIHNAGYAGALLGLVAAIMFVRRGVR